MHQKFFLPRFNLFGVHKGSDFKFTEVARGDLNGDADMPEMKTSDLITSIGSFINNGAATTPRSLKIFSAASTRASLKCSVARLKAEGRLYKKFRF